MSDLRTVSFIAGMVTNTLKHVTFNTECPEAIKPHLLDVGMNPVEFANVMLCLEWNNDTATQICVIDFLE